MEQKHLDKVSHREGYYLTNILPFRDVCKHVHAARLSVIPAENKNILIYEGDTDIAYDEIIRPYYLQDNISERNSDPFKPPELKHKTKKGAPSKAVTKPRKPSRILQTLQSNSQNETNSFASEKRNTKRARKNLRNTN
ncbi:674_t:CDS:2, partial [Funneliformis mosseae]